MTASDSSVPRSVAWGLVAAGAVLLLAGVTVPGFFTLSRLLGSSFGAAGTFMTVVTIAVALFALGLGLSLTRSVWVSPRLAVATGAAGFAAAVVYAPQLELSVTASYPQLFLGFLAGLAVLLIAPSLAHGSRIDGRPRRLGYSPIALALVLLALAGVAFAWQSAGLEDILVLAGVLVAVCALLWPGRKLQRRRREAVGAHLSHAGSLATANGVVYLGGAGYDFVVRSSYTLVFEADAILVEPVGELSHAVPYASVRDLAIGGRGLMESGGGFIGGGLGVRGTLEGAAIATVLNTLTTRRRIETVLHIVTDSGEMFWAYDLESPDALRIRLSPAITRIASKQTSEVSAPSREKVTDLSRDLRHLAELRAAGDLTDDEFSVAKRRLLGLEES